MARDFNGSTMYLSHAASLAADYPFTLASRFNTDSTTATQTLLGLFNNTTGESAYLTIAVVTTFRASASCNDGGGFAHSFTSNNATGGIWQSIVGRFLSSTSRNCVLNGDTANAGGSITSKPIAGMDVTEFGRYGPFNNSYLDGRGAEAALWDIGLDDEEVRSYNDGISPLLIRPQSLVAYWPLIGKTSPEIDLVGGFSFTLNGAPAAAAHPRVYMPKKKQRYVFISGTSVYNIPISVTAPRAASIQRQANIVTPTIPVRHVVSATRIGQLFAFIRRIGDVTLVTQIPTIFHIAIAVTVERVASLTQSTSVAVRKFVGHAGLGIFFRPVTRWTRRARGRRR